MISRVRTRVSLLLLLLLFSGCASRSVFTPYPQQAQQWRAATSTAATVDLGRLEKATTSRDAVLYLQELGRVAQLQGDIEGSRDAFARAMQVYAELDAAARVQGSALLASGAALLTNDNARPYQVPDYERIFAHAYQALNYWAQQDTTGTAVELRAAAQEQQVAANRRDREIARAEQQAAEEDLDLSRFEGQFAGLNAAVGEVKASFQNAWTFYLSALFWEARQEYNSAAVDLRKTLEIHPQLEFVQRDLQRVEAAMNGRRQPGGQLAVLFEQGFVPSRESFALPIPTIHGYFSVAFPTYSLAQKPAPYALQLLDSAGQPLAETRVLADVGGLAAKDLQERMPGMLVRQTLRAASKYNLQKKANEDFGLFGAFATQIYNLVSEQADLRGWLTLPAYAQAASVRLPAGEHRITLRSPGGTVEITVPVVDQGLTVIHAVAVPGELLTRVLPVQEGPL